MKLREAGFELRAPYVTAAAFGWLFLLPQSLATGESK
jgi:hypothetical protein